MHTIQGGLGTGPQQGCWCMLLRLLAASLRLIPCASPCCDSFPSLMFLPPFFHQGQGAQHHHLRVAHARHPSAAPDLEQAGPSVHRGWVAAPLILLRCRKLMLGLAEHPEHRQRMPGSKQRGAVGCCCCWLQGPAHCCMRLLLPGAGVCGLLAAATSSQRAQSSELPRQPCLRLAAAPPLSSPPAVLSRTSWLLLVMQCWPWTPPRCLCWTSDTPRCLWLSCAATRWATRRGEHAAAAHDAGAVCVSMRAGRCLPGLGRRCQGSRRAFWLRNTPLRALDPPLPACLPLAASWPAAR
jgi:hypothetical protein